MNHIYSSTVKINFSIEIYSLLVLIHIGDWKKLSKLDVV